MTELRFGLKPEVLSKLQQVLSRHANIDDAVIYGSRAKGNYRPGSDIDISLKGDYLALGELNQIERELDDLELPYTIDLSIYRQIDNPELASHIDRVGISLMQGFLPTNGQ